LAGLIIIDQQFSMETFEPVSIGKKLKADLKINRQNYVFANQLSALATCYFQAKFAIKKDKKNYNRV